MDMTTYLFYSLEPTKYMRRLDKIIEEEIMRIVENESNNEVQDNAWLSDYDPQQDPLLPEILQLAKNGEDVSFPALQKRYAIGPNRTSRIVSQLSQYGYQGGPQQGTQQQSQVQSDTSQYNDGEQQPQQEQEPQQQEEPQQEQSQEQDSVGAWDPNKWEDSNGEKQQDQGRRGRGRIFKTADANEQHAMLQDLVSNVGFSVTAATALAKILQIDPTFSQQPTQNQAEGTGGQSGQEQQQGAEGENWQANQQNGSAQMSQDVERQTSGEPLSSPESQDFIRRLVGDDFTPASNNVNIVYNSDENDQ